MISQHRRRWAAAGGSLLVLAAAGRAGAQNLGTGHKAQSASPSRSAADAASWPSRPLHLLVGFPGGSTPDLAARALADALGQALGQPVIIDNKAGASGNIAADAVAKARDEHTVGLLINGNLTVAKLLNPATPFDPARDFAPVSLVCTSPLVWVVPGHAAGNTPQELLQWARRLGVDGNYGSVGPGSVGHLGMELLKSKTGLATLHVPYGSNPAVVNALLSGQIQMALLPPAIAMPQVRAGKLKAIGVTSPARSTLVPELPPLREAGVTDADLEVWVALVAPASMPRAHVSKLSIALTTVLHHDDVRTRLLNAGWQVVGTAPDGLATRMKADTAQLGDIIVRQGIQSPG